MNLEQTLDKMSSYRCGGCDNCKQLERIKQRVLACANSQFTDYDVVELWNRELGRLPCPRVPYKTRRSRKALGVTEELSLEKA